MITAIIEDLKRNFPYYFDIDKVNWEDKLKINSTKEIEDVIEFIFTKYNN